jgi:hypothetical protein
MGHRRGYSACPRDHHDRVLECSRARRPLRDADALSRVPDTRISKPSVDAGSGALAAARGSSAPRRRLCRSGHRQGDLWSHVLQRGPHRGASTPRLCAEHRSDERAVGDRHCLRNERAAGSPSTSRATCRAAISADARSWRGSGSCPATAIPRSMAKAACFRF